MQKIKFKKDEVFQKAIKTNKDIIELFETVGASMKDEGCGEWTLDGFYVKAALGKESKRLYFMWIDPTNPLNKVRLFIMFNGWRDNLLNSLQEKVEEFCKKCEAYIRKRKAAKHWGGVAKLIGERIPETTATYWGYGNMSILFQKQEYTLTVKGKPTLSFKSSIDRISNGVDLYVLKTELDKQFNYAKLLCDLLRANKIVDIKFK